MLEAIVTGDGCASQIRVVRSLDRGGLDEEAVAAVAQWRFEPGRLAGDSLKGKYRGCPLLVLGVTHIMRRHSRLGQYGDAFFSHLKWKGGGPPDPATLAGISSVFLNATTLDVVGPGLWRRPLPGESRAALSPLIRADVSVHLRGEELHPRDRLPGRCQRPPG